MKTYVSLLRGINVSGQKKILMTELVALYKNLEFNNVRTYIQSGNVVFNAPSKIPIENIINKIEEKIYDKFNFNVTVIIRSIEELKNIINNNPYLVEKNFNEEKIYVTFLSKLPAKLLVESLKIIDHSPDRFIISGNEIYLSLANGYGTTRLSNNFFENKLRLPATTRNWKTVNKLYQLALEQNQLNII